MYSKQFKDSVAGFRVVVQELGVNYTERAIYLQLPLMVNFKYFQRGNFRFFKVTQERVFTFSYLPRANFRFFWSNSEPNYATLKNQN